MGKAKHKKLSPRREYLHQVIFGSETKAGKRFDIILLVAILASVVIVLIESVPSYQESHGELFRILEWIFTLFFTIEYGLRLYSVRSQKKYATSFFGIIDLLSILPSFLSFFFAGTASLMVIRGLRLIRVFRIFKLANFLSQGQTIVKALKASRPKIIVFVIFILIMVTIFGSIMYLIEGASNKQFDSIPRSIYWAIVTLTTVGYGDISPVTPIGQAIAAFIMISGYAIIAVPTGIVTAEAMNYANDSKNINLTNQTCTNCSEEGHDVDAIHCKYCGEELNSK